MREKKGRRRKTKEIEKKNGKKTPFLQFS